MLTTLIKFIKAPLPTKYESLNLPDKIYQIRPLSH